MIWKGKKRTIEDVCYTAGLCVPGVLFLAFFLVRILPHPLRRMLFAPCLFHAVTGIYCPGCGGTRAVFALLEGKILLSALYHPLVFYAIACYLFFMISHTVSHLFLRRSGKGMRIRAGYLYAALAIAIINTAVKDIALTAFRIDLLRMLDALWFLI